MKKLVWSLQAAEDLRTIYFFYYNQSPDAAHKIYNRIKKESERLRRLPYIAPIESLLEDEIEIFRSLVVLQHFKVIYTIEDNFIYIVHVWDCRQDPIRLIQKIR
ncbi:MAG: type II toxin-antitoxin system RelE/ParE family toxin [Tannerellaceae bacterium]|nr:type II toxin-antitoxin system RelE/ParE family toxin [Tannerellaceae bacterium]